jgi:hypothetical protein
MPFERKAWSDRAAGQQWGAAGGAPAFPHAAPVDMKRGAESDDEEVVPLVPPEPKRVDGGDRHRTEYRSGDDDDVAFDDEDLFDYEPCETEKKTIEELKEQVRKLQAQLGESAQLVEELMREGLGQMALAQTQPTPAPARAPARAHARASARAPTPGPSTPAPPHGVDARVREIATAGSPIIEVRVAANSVHNGKALLYVDKPHHILVRFSAPHSSAGNPQLPTDAAVYVAASGDTGSEWKSDGGKVFKTDTISGPRKLPVKWPGVSYRPGVVVVANHAQADDKTTVGVEYRERVGALRTCSPNVTVTFVGNNDLGYSCYRILVKATDALGHSPWRKVEAPRTVEGRKYTVFELGGLYFIPRRSLKHSSTNTPGGTGALAMWSAPGEALGDASDMQLAVPVTFNYLGDGVGDPRSLYPNILAGAAEKSGRRHKKELVDDEEAGSEDDESASLGHDTPSAGRSSSGAVSGPSDYVPPSDDRPAAADTQTNAAAADAVVHSMSALWNDRRASP